MSNTNKKTPAVITDGGETRARLQVEARGGDPLAGLSEQHIQACREAAKLPLLNLTLALRLLEREKAQQYRQGGGLEA